MPELPEVETIVRALRPKLIGRTICCAHVFWPRTLAAPQLNEFKKRIQNCKFAEVTRLGKFLVFRLQPQDKSKASSSEFMLLHLRMSGSLSIVRSGLARETHDRAILDLDNQTELRFNDIRKFGKLYLLKDHRQITGKLGPDAILQTPSAEEFFLRLHARKVGLKSLLLNQSFIAGLGNIYVDESLWMSKLHPLSRSDHLTRAQTNLLLQCIIKVLKRAIRFSGTDAGDGVVDFGRNKPKVYGREGLYCPRCKQRAIVRIVVGQRGTHLCPDCQKKSRKRK